MAKAMAVPVAQQSADQALGQVLVNAAAVQPEEAQVATPAVVVPAAPKAKVQEQVNTLLEAQKALVDKAKAIKVQLDQIKKDAEEGKNDAILTSRPKEKIKDMEALVALYSKVKNITFTEAHRAVTRFVEDPNAFRKQIGALNWNKHGFALHMEYVDQITLAKQ